MKRFLVYLIVEPQGDTRWIHVAHARAWGSDHGHFFMDRHLVLFAF